MRRSNFRFFSTCLPASRLRSSLPSGQITREKITIQFLDDQSSSGQAEIKLFAGYIFLTKGCSNVVRELVQFISVEVVVVVRWRQLFLANSVSCFIWWFITLACTHLDFGRKPLQNYIWQAKLKQNGATNPS